MRIYSVVFGCSHGVVSPPPRLANLAMPGPGNPTYVDTKSSILLVIEL